MEEKIVKRDIIKKLIVGFFLIVGIVGAYYGFVYYKSYLAENQVEQINNIIYEDKISRDDCKIVLDFDKKLISKDNEFFDEKKYDDFRGRCDLKYNIENIDFELETCKEIIELPKVYFEDRFILLDKYEEVQKKCIDKFLKVTFSTGSFFDVENDFKSTVNLDFSAPFYKDLGEENSDEYLDNRIEAKKRLAGLIEITPNIKFDYKDIILYPNRAIINFELEPLNDYNISIKSFNSGIGDEQIEKQIFSLKTPENKYFGFKILNKVSLYKDDIPPRFQLLEYNSLKTKTKIKICRIDNESYSKIEVFRESDGLIKEKKDFFKNKIDEIEAYECNEKEIVIKDSGDSNSELKLVKKDFNFDDLIGEVSRSGLYYVTFSDKEDRDFNNRVQPAIFFGIIDSHIVMKTSKSGETFFFVNDFSGKPLANQEVRVYVNEFMGKDKKWDNKLRKYNEQYFSPLGVRVLSTPIFLGKTNKDGILRINLEDKVKGTFDKTFESWDFNWNGNYNSLFITSASEDNLSFISSKWNSGIAPWNFGYSIGSNWWGSIKSENDDEIFLDRYGINQNELFSHIYTDRKLYLPGEDVNIKFVGRNSRDLSIPVGKEINLIVLDSKGKEVINKNIKIGEFGSFSEKISLKEVASIGNYIIQAFYNDKQIGYSGFSVEVFKNPKFKNEIILDTDGLNGNLVKIDSEEKGKYSWQTKYKGKFKIKANVDSTYFSGPPVKNAEFTYKVYKQYYYENSYWDNCFYGCYWEPEKEFYTEGKGLLNDDGKGNFEVDIDFESNYSDYKYIVEVSVTDNAGDNISGANSIIAKLSSEYKRWNPKSGIYFSSDKRFYKSGEEIVLNGKLTEGNWTDDFNDKYVLIIKKKEYETKILDDVRGYERPITRSKESLEKILKVNKSNFKISDTGEIKLRYKAESTGEYIFEFGNLNTDNLEFISYNIDDFIKEFSKKEKKEIITEVKKEVIIDYGTVDFLIKNCVGKSTDCNRSTIYKELGCTKGYINSVCSGKKKEITIKQKIKLDDIIDSNSRKFFTIISYSDKKSENPIKSDNKITVLSEKISYSLGEKARVMVRLPYSNGKILWTIEKSGVIESEYINVKGNTFFKEITIDDKFIPNAYIGVVAIDTRKGVIPEYKVGYTEIVVDKTDKKSFIKISSDKEEYKPREEVNLEIINKDKKGKGNKSELTVMVVDDSLISLMGNVDLNTLEKFYRKLSFQIQTSITNIAMLNNYYFSRPGIVGGSGFGNFKGGDSAVSSRNIFKNTAYYNASVITDKNGKANVKFTLPDNLTSFRIMVISNSKDNYFGYAEDYINVRKNVVVEDKTPKILRLGDKIILGANVFNNTDKEIGFKVKFESEELDIKDSEKIAMIAGNNKEFIYWEVENNKDVENINYKITVLGDSEENSDKVEGKIEVKQSPVLISNVIKSGYIDGGETFEEEIIVANDVDLDKTKVEVIFSNYRLNDIYKIVNSLAVYPYGCIEQTTSATYPNAILLKYYKTFSGMIKNRVNVSTNLKAGLDRIKGMQTDEGGFAYWPGSSTTDLHITPFVLRRLIDMKEFGANVDDKVINKAIKYLENNIGNITEDVDIGETFLALVKAGKSDFAYNNLIKGEDTEKFSRHALLSYTYGLVLFDKSRFKEQINSNIDKIKKLLDVEENNYRYWNKMSDKAIFLSMLIDYKYDSKYIDEEINKLYSYDWSSYYYSTQAKNNAFIAFFKYVENNKKRYNKFGFSLGMEMNREKLFWLGHGAPNIVKKEYLLKDLVYNSKIDLKVANIDGTPMAIDLIMKKYPKDITQISSYSNKINVTRDIYEVKDETKFDKCNQKLNNYNNRHYSDESEISGCENILVKHNESIFKKGGLYKVKIKVNLKDIKDRRNVVIEDYLASGFRVINSKFNTESIGLREATTGNFYRSHLEIKSDVVFYSIDYSWRDIVEFEYFFRAEFEGEFVYPPVTTYMMYNPIIRAHSTFRKIIIK